MKSYLRSIGAASLGLGLVLFAIPASMPVLNNLVAAKSAALWDFGAARAGGVATASVTFTTAKGFAAGSTATIHLPYTDLANVTSEDIEFGGVACAMAKSSDSGELGASVSCTTSSPISPGSFSIEVGGVGLPKMVILNQSADLLVAGVRMHGVENVDPQQDPATSVVVGVYPVNSAGTTGYNAHLLAQLVDASGDPTNNGGNVVALGFSSTDMSATLSPYEGTTAPNGANNPGICAGPGTVGAGLTSSSFGEVVCNVYAPTSKVSVSVDAAGSAFESPEPMVGIGKNKVVSIGAAAYNSYLVTKSGGVLATGENPLDELGNGSSVAYASSPVSVTLPTGTRVSSVVGGGYFALALTDSGTVLGWGQNDQGQLGQGTQSLDVATPTPTALPTGVQATQIAAGCNSAYALTSTGQVYAWGADYSGQLGDSGRAQQDTPVLVDLPTGVQATQIAAGCNNAYALTSSGQVYSWGSNSAGQLGNGKQGGSVSSPVLVSMPTGIVPVQLSSGNSNGYVLSSLGHVYAWGAGDLGQLGDGSVSNADGPVEVSLTQGTITSVVGGGFNAFAITSTHKLYAWGGNYDGQDGVGSLTELLLPEQVDMPGGVGVDQVNGASAGGFASMGLASNGQVFTWGANFDDQLGIGVLTTGYHSLALGTSGQLYAWGDNRTGGFGMTSPSESETPIAVTFGKPIAALASGCDHSLALTSTGQVYAWGANQDGQLGTGSVGGIEPPTLVNLPEPATSIVAGCLSSYALTSTGQVYAWGANQDGQLGTGSVDASSVPAVVGLTSSVKQVVAGEYSAYALTLETPIHPGNWSPKTEESAP